MRRHNATHQLIAALQEFNQNICPLPGLQDHTYYSTFAMQLIDSIRRIKYVENISKGNKKITHLRAEPNSEYFDPLLASRFHHEQGNYDEACWLIFLFTHFGKSIKTNWQICRDIYGGLGEHTWTWKSITQNFSDFENWFERVSPELVRTSIQRQYGNHRKYETLKSNSKRSIPNVFKSYIQFIGHTYSHEARFAEANSVAPTPESLFELLYSNMRNVISFGRTAKFDYLTMLRKTDLLNIQPGHLFLTGSTGPIKGCRLLFNNNKDFGDIITDLNEKLVDLSELIPLQYLRMQVLEDALCNWQKSPNSYVYFRG